MLVLGDTCSIEYCFKGELLEKLQKEKFTHFLITEEVLVEIRRRVPKVLNIMKYSITQMTIDELETAIEIADIALELFEKDDFTIADTSLISVASNRNIPIYSDNKAIYWFYQEFLPRDYKKEPYKSAKKNIEEKLKYIPEIYMSSSVVPELYSSNNDGLLKYLSNFTAKSDYWFKREHLINLGLDYDTYITKVMKTKLL